MFLALVMTGSLWVFLYLLFLFSVLRRLFLLLLIYYWWWVTERYGQTDHLLKELVRLILIYYYPRIYFQWLCLICFQFWFKNLLYKIGYKLLIRKINIFSDCCHGDNLCLCLHIIGIQVLIFWKWLTMSTFGQWEIFFV
jgi:hypothetical protein